MAFSFEDLLKVLNPIGAMDELGVSPMDALKYASPIGVMNELGVSPGDILKYSSPIGLLGLADISSPMDAVALGGGVIPAAIAGQVSPGKAANAVGSVARAMPAAAAASLAGGAAGGVMDEQEKMRRRMLGLYT